MPLSALVRNWWMMAARGLLAMLFGVALAAWPGVTLPAVVVLFATYAVLDGAWAVAAGARASSRRLEAWPVGLEGVVSIALGILALVWPFVSREFISLVVLWGLLTGVLELATALAVPREATGRWLLATGGASSLFLAVLVQLLPRADAAGIVRLIAVYALVFGLALFLAAVLFRRAGGPASLEGAPAP